MKKDITFEDIEKAVSIINSHYDSNLSDYMFPAELVSTGAITNDNLNALISRLEGLGLIQIIPNSYGDKRIKRLDACKSYLLTRNEARNDIDRADKRSITAIIISIFALIITILNTLALYLTL